MGEGGTSNNAGSQHLDVDNPRRSDVYIKLIDPQNPACAQYQKIWIGRVLKISEGAKQVVGKSQAAAKKVRQKLEEIKSTVVLAADVTFRFNADDGKYLVATEASVLVLLKQVRTRSFGELSWSDHGFCTYVIIFDGGSLSNPRSRLARELDNQTVEEFPFLLPMCPLSLKNVIISLDTRLPRLLCLIQRSFHFQDCTGEKELFFC